MAVALEVGWGSGELGGGIVSARMSKKRAWGDDHQKLLEMMMGKPFDESAAGQRHQHTLDLLGGRAVASSAASIATDGEQQRSDFLELGEDVPLPSGWEKRLDLKSGTVFFINWNTGETSYSDPRKSSPCPTASLNLGAPSTCHLSLELLQSELRPKTTSGITTNKQQQQQQQHHQSSSRSSREKETAVDDGDVTGGSVYHDSDNGHLDLQLNLSSSSKQDQEDTSSVTTSSECLCLLPPAASSPKSPSRKSPDREVARVTLTACKRCLMYVMISQLDPRCPKCGSSVIMDFPVAKKQRKFDLDL